MLITVTKNIKAIEKTLQENGYIITEGKGTKAFNNIARKTTNPNGITTFGITQPEDIEEANNLGNVLKKAGAESVVHEY